MSTLRSPDRLLAALLALAAAGAQAADPYDPAIEKARIAVQRREAEDAFAARKRECSTHFVVTACIEEARTRRREALDRLDREQAVIDDAERKQRAAERLRDIDEKRRAAEERDARAMPRDPHAPHEPASSAAHPVAPVPLPQREAAPTAAEQASRKSAFDARQREAAEHRQTVEKRNAERNADHRRSAPLPLPQASAASQSN